MKIISQDENQHQYFAEFGRQGKLLATELVRQKVCRPVKHGRQKLFCAAEQGRQGLFYFVDHGR